MNSSQRFAYIIFTALGIFWGSNFLFMKMAVAVISPLQIVWMRVVFGSIPILGFALYKRSLRWSDLKYWYHFLAMALISNVLPLYLFVRGTELIPSGIAGVTAGTIPLLTALLAILFLRKERLTIRKIMGLISGLCGVILLAHLETALSVGINDDLIGAAYMLSGSVFFALAIVYAKKFLMPLKMSSLQLATYQTLIAAVILAAITPTAGLTNIVDDPVIFCVVIFGLALFGTGLAYIMYYFIIDKLGAVTASSVYYIPPVVALIMGAIFRGEIISTSQGIGTCLIIFGIFLARG